MCFDFDACPPDLPADRVRAAASVPRVEDLVLAAPDGGEVAAVLARIHGNAACGVVILPDVRGLYRFYGILAQRFASAGHPAIAIDYFGRTAGQGKRHDDFDFMQHLGHTSPEQIQMDVAAAREALVDHCGPRLVAIVGFCFGGTHAFLAATNPRLEVDAVVGFYGTLDGRRSGLDWYPSPLVHVHETVRPVLGLFGGDDAYIPAGDIQLFDRRLDEAGVRHQIVTYPGAPHSFFDRSFAQYTNESANAWSRVLDFLELLHA